MWALKLNFGVFTCFLYNFFFSNIFISVIVNFIQFSAKAQLCITVQCCHPLRCKKCMDLIKFTSTWINKMTVMKTFHTLLPTYIWIFIWNISPLTTFMHRNVFLLNFSICMSSFSYIHIHIYNYLLPFSYTLFLYLSTCVTLRSHMRDVTYAANPLY